MSLYHKFEINGKYIRQVADALKYKLQLQNYNVGRLSQLISLLFFFFIEVGLGSVPN